MEEREGEGVGRAAGAADDSASGFRHPQNVSAKHLIPDSTHHCVDGRLVDGVHRAQQPADAQVAITGGEIGRGACARVSVHVLGAGASQAAHSQAATAKGDEALTG